MGINTAKISIFLLRTKQIRRELTKYNKTRLPLHDITTNKIFLRDMKYDDERQTDDDDKGKTTLDGSDKAGREFARSKVGVRGMAL